MRCESIVHPSSCRGTCNLQDRSRSFASQKQVSKPLPFTSQSTKQCPNSVNSPIDRLLVCCRNQLALSIFFGAKKLSTEAVRRERRSAWQDAPRTRGPHAPTSGRSSKKTPQKSLDKVVSRPPSCTRTHCTLFFPPGRWYRSAPDLPCANARPVYMFPKEGAVFSTNCWDPLGTHLLGLKANAVGAQPPRKCTAVFFHGHRPPPWYMLPWYAAATSSIVHGGIYIYIYLVVGHLYSGR